MLSHHQCPGGLRGASQPTSPRPQARLHPGADYQKEAHEAQAESTGKAVTLGLPAGGSERWALRGSLSISLDISCHFVHPPETGHQAESLEDCRLHLRFQAASDFKFILPRRSNLKELGFKQWLPFAKHSSA